VLGVSGGGGHSTGLLGQAAGWDKRLWDRRAQGFGLGRSGVEEPFGSVAVRCSGAGAIRGAKQCIRKRSAASSAHGLARRMEAAAQRVSEAPEAVGVRLQQAGARAAMCPAAACAARHHSLIGPSSATHVRALKRRTTTSGGSGSRRVPPPAAPSSHQQPQRRYGIKKPTCWLGRIHDSNPYSCFERQ
jgi:hypothetical protein